MSYLWQEFNIKTFPAETLVFRDGVFCEDLSDYKSAEYFPGINIIDINKKSDLPIHIIYVGNIENENELKININAGNCNVFMTTRIKTEKEAKLNIHVKNTGQNSIFNGKIVAENHKLLKIDAFGEHLASNTGIFIKTHVLAYKDSETELNGYAIIDKNLQDCESDVSFSVMADENAKIKMKPVQNIKSVPICASHSASLYKPNDFQINYLKSSGLSDSEVKDILSEAFLSL